MTAIAGFCDQGKVWIGADSAAVAGLDLMVRADSKVFRNGEFLFGFTSSFRMGQLLRYKLQPPKQHDLDTYAFMVTVFVDAVRECLKAGLFYVGADYQVAESMDGYDACGCGQAIILGALFATKGMEPHARMKVALEAAERHSAGVRGPFPIEAI